PSASLLSSLSLHDALPISVVVLIGILVRLAVCERIRVGLGALHVIGTPAANARDSAATVEEKDHQAGDDDAGQPEASSHLTHQHGDEKVASATVAAAEVGTPGIAATLGAAGGVA